MPRKPMEEKLTPEEMAVLHSIRVAGKAVDDLTRDELMFLYRLHAERRVSVKELAEFLGLDYNKLRRRIRSFKDVFKKLSQIKEEVMRDEARQARRSDIDQTVYNLLGQEGKVGDTGMPRRKKENVDELDLSTITEEEAHRKPGPAEISVLKTISAEVANDASLRAKMFYDLGKSIFSIIITDGFKKYPQLADMAKTMGIDKAAVEFVKKAIDAYIKMDEAIREARRTIRHLVEIINEQASIIDYLYQMASPFIKFDIETRLLLDLLDRMILAKALGVRIPRNLAKLLKTVANERFLEAVETWLKQTRS